MAQPFILASGSDVRAQLLRQAGVPFAVEAPRVDEDTVKAALIADGAPPRDVADALAELKATKVSARQTDALVMGCDQVLDLDGTLLSKPATQADALAQLAAMRGQVHHLLSAAVISEAGRPVWRNVGHVRLTMRQASDTFLESYVARNWESIRHAVGAYKLEEEGVRLFTRVDGDYFNVLGMPLLQVLGYLGVRGVIEQ